MMDLLHRVYDLDSPKGAEHFSKNLREVADMIDDGRLLPSFVQLSLMTQENEAGLRVYFAAWSRSRMGHPREMKVLPGGKES